MGPGLFESWYLLSTSLFLPAPFRLSRILLQEGEGGVVGCELEMEKEGRNGGGREAGVDMAMDSQRPLGPEAFFTGGETEAKGQRLDEDHTESPGGGQDGPRLLIWSLSGKGEKGRALS